MTDRELMQQALEALEEGLTSKEWRELAAALRERLAQPQRTHWEGCKEVHPECRKPEQEPVAWADEIIDDLHAQYNTDGIKEIDSGDALIRLDEAIAAVEEAEKRHTAPPQRKPLTDEEIDDLWLSPPEEVRNVRFRHTKFARAIERAHGIKENT